MFKNCNTCLYGENGFCNIHHTVPGGCEDYVPNSSESDLIEYRKLGTVEELKKRFTAKKPIIKVNGEDLKIGCVIFKAGAKTYWCPECKKPITGSDHFCRWCGKEIDWNIGKENNNKAINGVRKEERKMLETNNNNDG